MGAPLQPVPRAAGGWTLCPHYTCEHRRALVSVQWMALRRPRLVLLALAGAAAVWPAACSSSGRRDQNYGTDAGATYRAPEASALPGPEAGVGDRTAGGETGDATGRVESGDGGAPDAVSDGVRAMQTTAPRGS